MQTERENAILGDRYVLQAEIGRGKTTTVWRAADRVLDRFVAVKLLHPALAADAASSARFVEAARAASLISHAGIARVLDTGRDEGTGMLFVVEELVDGESLERIVERDGPIDQARGARYASQVLTALAAAREGGVISTSLGPCDVVLCRGDRVVVTALHPGPGPADDGETCAALFAAITGQPAEAFVPSVAPGREEAAGVAPARADEDGSFFRRWMLVPLAIATLMAAAIAVGLAAGRLQLGGPLGIRPRVSESPRPAARALPVAGVRSFDPLGDRVENDGAVPLAADGDPTTVWRSENYFDGTLHKAGVGLLFDLGSQQAVTGFRLTAPTGGFRFQVLVGDDPNAMVQAGGPSFTASSGETRAPLRQARGRFVLLWFTSVVDTGDGNRVDVGEFKVVGPGA